MPILYEKAPILIYVFTFEIFVNIPLRRYWFGNTPNDFNMLYDLRLGCLRRFMYMILRSMLSIDLDRPYKWHI